MLVKVLKTLRYQTERKALPSPGPYLYMCIDGTEAGGDTNPSVRQDAARITKDEDENKGPAERMQNREG